MTWQEALITLLEICLVGFTVAYAAANTVLLVLGFNPARNQVRALSFADLDVMDRDENCPPVAILVPAYNEQMGIAQSVRAFLELDHPRFEVIVVNDGSRDDTMRVLTDAFSLRRRDIASRADLQTAAVIAVYEPVMALPSRVQRLVVIDKENGGRADALNCAMNFARSPYVLTIDADSILDPTALKLVMRVFEEDPEVHAAGGQIGIVNECTVESGRVTNAVIPRKFLTLCQTVEYLRSFATSRTGLSRMGCLSILSGAFLMIRRETAIALGGFLTGRVRSRLLDEYSGAGKSTVGEDMEIIVRLHRFERESGQRAKVVHCPVPVCWTEAPETWTVLGRQRRRWHRGFLEILSYHRRMIFNPAYGRIGLISLPYLVLFELLGPYLEALGYILLPLLAILGFIHVKGALMLLAVTLGFGVLHSTFSVLCATWLEPVAPGGSRMRSLTAMDGWRSRVLLLLGCILSEIGYRQATVWWRMHGTWEYFRGVQVWGAMERRGFRTSVGAATAALALLGFATSARGEDPALAWRPAAWALGGVEMRDGEVLARWTETAGRWGETREGVPTGRAIWAGLYRWERRDEIDGGAILGAGFQSARRWGMYMEGRFAPEASITPSVFLHCEAEAALRAPVSASGVLRWSRHGNASVTEVGTGTVVYFPNDAWLSLRGHLWRTDWSDGRSDHLAGGMASFQFPAGPATLRLLAATGGESYLTGGGAATATLHARSLGMVARIPVGASWRTEVGVTSRDPEVGENEAHLHAGLHKSF